MSEIVSQSPALRHRTRSHTSRRLARIRPATTPAFAAPSVLQPVAWATRAVSAFHALKQHDAASLKQELAQRLSTLLGLDLSAASMYVNQRERFAQAKVSGYVFRLQAGRLVLLRACAHCGLGHFESPEIWSLSDVGCALSEWEPRCPYCAPEDPGNWIEANDEQLHAVC